MSAFLTPMAAWPPLASLALVSFVTAVALLAAFKLTSNQAGLRRAKRAVSAGLLELRLFEHDPSLVWRAMRGLLAAQARYLRYACVPLLWAALPLLVLFAHLDAWYARAPLASGASSLVVFRVSSFVARSARPALSLDAPAGVRVETPVVWWPARREAAWRVRADRPGRYTLHAHADDVDLTHVLHVGDRLARLDPPWSDHDVDLVNVLYPPRRFDVWGLLLSWPPVFLALTLLSTLLLRPIFGVTL